MTSSGIIDGERLAKLMKLSNERERKRSIDKAEGKERKAAANHAKTEAYTSPHAVIRCIEDVQAVPIHWLWPERIACGKLTILAGDPGLGKSQITAALAGIVTTGGLWPVDGSKSDQGAVIFLSAEDDCGDTIRPRLEAVGADLSKCFILDQIQESNENGNVISRFFNLKTDLAWLYEAICKIGNVRLIVIDPITAYLGGVDSHKNADVRTLLCPLSELAAYCKLAIVGVTHLNKSNTQEAMQRVSGSGAFVATARAGYFVIKDKANPSRRLLLPIKNNIAKDTGGLVFSVQSAEIANGIQTSRVEWEKEPVTITADEAMRIDLEARNGELDKAKNFLLELLENGPVKSKEAKSQYQDKGIAKRTIERAIKELGIESFAVPEEGKNVWFWKFANDKNAESCKKVGEHGEHCAVTGFQPIKNDENGHVRQIFSVGEHAKNHLKPTAQNASELGANLEPEIAENLTL